MANPAKIPSAEYEEFAEAFRVRHPEIERGSLFGMSSLKFAGSAFAGGFASGLAIKVTEARAQEQLALPDAEPFDPSGRGRPMRGWVVIGVSRQSEWMPLADAALEIAARGA